MNDPKDVDYRTVDFNFKVNEFKGITEFLLRCSVTCMGLPQMICSMTSSRVTGPQ
ncbi:MAG: hypothetical protein OEW49_00515 [Nitrosopumilus sp.]|nr:hypothetical protein [Nitrosopumilus sp.]